MNSKLPLTGCVTIVSLGKIIVHERSRAFRSFTCRWKLAGSAGSLMWCYLSQQRSPSSILLTFEKQKNHVAGEQTQKWPGSVCLSPGYWIFWEVQLLGTQRCWHQSALDSKGYYRSSPIAPHLRILSSRSCIFLLPPNMLYFQSFLHFSPLPVPVFILSILFQDALLGPSVFLY